MMTSIVKHRAAAVAHLVAADIHLHNLDETGANATAAAALLSEEAAFADPFLSEDSYAWSGMAEEYAAVLDGGTGADHRAARDAHLSAADAHETAAAILGEN